MVNKDDNYTSFIIFIHRLPRNEDNDVFVEYSSVATICLDTTELDNILFHDLSPYALDTTWITCSTGLLHGVV